MKTKKIITIILMIIFLFILEGIVKATEENPEETINSEKIEIEENKEYNIKQEITLQTMPIIYSKEKQKIEEGSIKILEKLNDWYRISNSENEGWARKNKIDEAILTEKIEDTENAESDEIENSNDEPKVENKDNEEQEENTQNVTELNKTGYVKADGLNIRKEPTTASEAIHSLSFNSKITITGEIDGWYRIKYENKDGYVSKKYVSDTKLPENTTRGGVERNAVVNNQEIEKVENTSENESEEIPLSSEDVTGSQIVEYAKKYLGCKYVSGGVSPTKGFDCSGFTTYVFKHFGISLNRTSKDQIKNGVAVQKSQLQQGDLVVFNNEANSAIGHVGIYIGNDKFIHSANKKEGVTITSLSMSYYAKRYVGARRVI